jgi:hypothetical protein
MADQTTRLAVLETMVDNMKQVHDELLERTSAIQLSVAKLEELVEVVKNNKTRVENVEQTVGKHATFWKIFGYCLGTGLVGGGTFSMLLDALNK